MSSMVTNGATVSARDGLTAYTMSKHAIEGLTQTMALEYAKYGIRVNAVAPAVVETEMVAKWFGDNTAGQEQAARDNPLGTPFGGMIHVDDVAGIVAFLCSEKAKWINGALIPIDGGYSCY